MKQFFSAVVLVSLLVAACSKAPLPPFAKATPQYAFFQTLSDSLKLKAMNPEKATALVTTKSFKVYTFDIMPGLYARFGRYSKNLDKLPVDQLKNTITQGAQSEAEKRLLLAKAQSEGVAVPDSAVNDQLEQIYSSRGGKESFQKFVEQQGFTMDFVEKDIRTQLTIQKYIDDVLEPSIKVSDDELKTAYEQDKTATVRHILFLTQGKSEADKAKIRKTAEDVLKRAKNNEDFAQLAQEFSEDPGSKNKGGLYEKFPRGRMVKAFEDASFNLPIGSISDLVETPYGFHIIKVEGREKETQPMEQVKEQLTNQIQQSKRRDVYNDLIQQLKEKAGYKEHFEIMG
jgi:foldase protein PrsA